jgi:hypothetical protein
MMLVVGVLLLLRCEAGRVALSLAALMIVHAQSGALPMRQGGFERRPLRRWRQRRRRIDDGQLFDLMRMGQDNRQQQAPMRVGRSNSGFLAR